MDNKKTGDYISTLRKERDLTQRELADLLGVTDKAISKWERGAGYPDITMLRPLADILGITVNDLLEGESLDYDINPKGEVISNALSYADKLVKIKQYSKGKILAAIIAITLFLALSVCVIVNVAVNQNITWSVFVIAGCIFTGLLIIPPLLVKKKGLLLSLIMFTLFIMPFLAVIQYETRSTSTTYTLITDTTAYQVTSLEKAPLWIWRLAFPIVITWLTIIWTMVILYRLKKLSTWFLITIGTLLCIPGHIVTNAVVDRFVSADIPQVTQITLVSTTIVLIAIAGICFVVGLIKIDMNRVRKAKNNYPK